MRGTPSREGVGHGHIRKLLNARTLGAFNKKVVGVFGSGNEEVCLELAFLPFAEFRGPGRDGVAGGDLSLCWKEAAGQISAGEDVTSIVGFMYCKPPSREC